MTKLAAAATWVALATWALARPAAAKSRAPKPHLLFALGERSFEANARATRSPTFQTAFGAGSILYALLAVARN